ncbi:MAG: hypothetical protein ACRDYA_09940 [Egibacteraceae bacterium]
MPPSGEFTEIDPQEAQRREVPVHGIDGVRFALGDQKRLTAWALSEASASRVRSVIG